MHSSNDRAGNILSRHDLFHSFTLITHLATNLNSREIEAIGDLFFGKWYTGKLVDVIILNKALPEQEVISLFNLLRCCEE